MTKTNKIETLLDQFVETPSIEEAARRTGIAARSVHRWLVASRLGDEKLQSVLFCETRAPFHIQFENAAKLAARAIEASAMERAKNGSLTPAFFQGQQKFKLIDPKKHKELIALGLQDEDDLFERDDQGNRIPEMIYSKPSDSLVQLMLQSHFVKKYGAKQEVNVNYAERLTLTRPEERTARIIENDATKQLVFDDESSAPEVKGQSIAAGRPATSAEEFDKWSAAKEFEHSGVEIEQSDGTFKTMRASGVHQPEGKANLGDGAKHYGDPEEKITGSEQPADGVNKPLITNSATHDFGEAKPKRMMLGMEIGPDGMPIHPKKPSANYASGKPASAGHGERTGAGSNPAHRGGSGEPNLGFKR